jgi:CheY-like chemotaxis protein
MPKMRRDTTLQKLLVRPAPEPRPEVPEELRARVLIVAGDRREGRHLARMLTATGYEGVRAVSSAARALVLAQQHGASIVFLDVALAEDAYELASALRRQAGKDPLRIIALTTSIEHSSRERARDAGFERWLVTPVAQSELDSLMARRESGARQPDAPT